MALTTYLVEDNDTIRHNLIETLEEVAPIRVAGYGSSQNEAVAWLTQQAHHWDLAIVDLFLREGSGLGVLSACRERKPQQKVVVVTNYATPDIRRRATGLGANAVFDKSSELDSLIAYCIDQAPNAGH